MRSAFSSRGVPFPGKQCARKRASTVWGGADRKGPTGTSLAAYSTPSTGGANSTPTPLAGKITEFAIATSGSSPGAITAGPDGNLWFTEYEKIGRITPTGTITGFPLPTSNNIVTGITKGPDGNLWLTDTGADEIGRITPTGTITEFALSTAESNPDGITAGPDHNLWFTESGTSKIGYTTPGK